MNLEKAPEKGIIYALYTDRVVFDRYEKENLPNDAVLPTSSVYFRCLRCCKAKR